MTGGTPNPANVTGARRATFDGPRATNPFLSTGAATPFIAGLDGGAEIYGLLENLNAGVLDYDLTTPGVIDAPPTDALAALFRLDLGPDSNPNDNNPEYADDYAGFDMLLFVNLTNGNLAAPQLSVLLGNDNNFLPQALLVGGIAGNPLFGGTAAQPLTSLAPGAIWATLIPDPTELDPEADTLSIAVNATIAGDNTGAAIGLVGETLIDGEVAYIRAARPDLGVAANLQSLNAIAVSPDSNQVYGLNADQNALVVINAETGSQRQLLVDGFDGVEGLAGATAIALSTDGANVYVTSAAEGAIAIFSRDSATGNLSFVDTVSEPSGEAFFNTLTVSADGTQVFTAGTDGIARLGRDASGGLTFQQIQATEAINEVLVSQDGNLLYAVSADTDTLQVLDPATLAVQQTITGIPNGLDGASDLALSGDDRFLYVTGQDGNTLTVFERDLATNELTRRQLLTNGADGVRGLAAPSDVTLTPDGQYVLVTGQVSNAVSVFERNAETGALTFVQVLRNNIGGTEGLRAPGAIAVAPDNGRTYVGSLGTGGNLGGLVSFNNDTDLPEPTQLLTNFDNIEALEVTTAGGKDTISLLNAPSAEVTATTINTGDNGDLVTLTDLSATTTVNLGEGDDEAQLRSDRPGTELTVNGDGGSDFVNVQQVGEETTTAIAGGTDPDTVRVNGKGIPASATVTASGNDPANVPTEEGDTLIFDPQNPDPTTPNFSPAPPTPGEGAIAVEGQGTLTYDTFEAVQVVAAPVFEFPNPVVAIAEGEDVTLVVNVTPLGSTNTLAGPVRWDLNGDGRFQDGEGEFLTLTWEQLVDLGLNDDGSFQVGVTATNGDGFTGEGFMTLVITNTLPTVTITGAPTVPLGESYTIDFQATDPGDDRVQEWRVDWGDGSPIEVFGSTTLSATHVYDLPDTYTIQVGAVDEDTDPDATLALQPQVVTVGVSPDQLTLGGPYTINEGEDLTLAGNAPGTFTTLEWDVNGDGVVDTTGTNPTLTWAELITLGLGNNQTVTIAANAVYEVNGVITRSPLATTSLTILNVAPTATFSNSGEILEGQTATVTFSDASDPSPVDIAAGFTYSYDFNNDGVFEVTGDTTGSVTVPNAFLNDNGTYVIRGVIQDQDGGQTEAFTAITVQNVEPILSVIGAAGVIEGAVYTLDLRAFDPGNDTIQQWTVDWGDGTVETFEGPVQSLTHLFRDNNVRTIAITAIDEDGVYTATQTVTVFNAPPQIQNLAATNIDENGFTRLTANISDPGVDDSFTVTVVWGDGTREDLALPAGTQQLELTHQYLDDRSDIIGVDTFPITVLLLDDDGEAALAGTSVTVSNVTPTIPGLMLSAPAIAEDGTITVSGTIEDPGSLDTHAVTLDWGDGTVETLVIDPTTRTFSATHQYGDDNPTGTTADDYIITATVIDDDGGVSSTSTVVTVENIEPTFTALNLTRSTDDEGLTVTLDGSFVDVGSLDTHTVEIDWGDGNTEILALPTAIRAFNFTHTYAELGIYEVTVRAIDDDGGIGDTQVDAVLSGVRLVNGELQIVGTNGDDTVTLQSTREPIAYWSFDETGGNTIRDRAGAPQTGTLFNRNRSARLNVAGADADFATGSGIEFNNRASDYVAVAHDPAFELENGTVQLWFNADRLVSEQTLFAKDGNGFGDGGHLKVQLQRGALVVRLQDQEQSFFLETGNLVTADTWYHLALTFGTEGLKLYLNGELVGENAYTGGILNNQEALVIGGSNALNQAENLDNLRISSPFDGRLDEMAIFGEALDQTAIQDLFNRGVEALRSETTPEIEVFASFLAPGEQRQRFAIADVNAIRIQLGDGEDDLRIAPTITSPITRLD